MHRTEAILTTSLSEQRSSPKQRTVQQGYSIPVPIRPPWPPRGSTADFPFGGGAGEVPTVGAHQCGYMVLEVAGTLRQGPPWLSGEPLRGSSDKQTNRGFALPPVSFSLMYSPYILTEALRLYHGPPLRERHPSFTALPMTPAGRVRMA